jgi:hypothetical protein
VLVAAIALSFGLGGATVAGLRAGLYGAEAAVELLAIATMVLFALVVWLQAASWQSTSEPARRTPPRPRQRGAPTGDSR